MHPIHFGHKAVFTPRFGAMETHGVPREGDGVDFERLEDEFCTGALQSAPGSIQDLVGVTMEENARYGYHSANRRIENSIMDFIDAMDRDHIPVASFIREIQLGLRQTGDYTPSTHRGGDDNHLPFLRWLESMERKHNDALEEMMEPEEWVRHRAGGIV